MPDSWERVSSTVSTRIAVNREQQLFYKEYQLRSPVEALQSMLRGSRATRARRHNAALLRAGIDAPESVLWGKLPGGREFVFTVAAPGENVRRWLCTTLVDKSKEQLRLRRQLLVELGTFIGRVHATGFLHGELTPENVLAAQQPDKFGFTLIDNEHNTIRKPPPGRMLLRNLTQLNRLPQSEVGRTDRMRFFCAWRKQMRDLSVIETKILAAEAFSRAMLGHVGKS